MPTWDLSGCVDMHLHSAPDVRPRTLDDIDLARAARTRGYRAIVIKSHHTLTADRAQIAQKVVGGVRVFGGLALNRPVGGLNPDAVETALKLGAKVIWLPTISATVEHEHRPTARGPVRVLDDEGELLPEIDEILSLIASSGAILATGHLGAREIFPLVRRAKALGVAHIVVSHPEHPLIKLTLEEQRALAEQGVWFERCYCFCAGALPEFPRLSLQSLAEAARTVGIESTILATDLGLASLPHPIDGFQSYLQGLHEWGLSWPELKRMAADTPARVLGL